MEKIHPALHANSDRGGVAVGLVYEKGYRAVVAPKTIHLPDAAVFTRPPDAFDGIKDRWPHDRFMAYVEAPSSPAWNVVYSRVYGLVDDWTTLRTDAERHIVASWSIATYFHQFWPAFPRLNFNGNAHTGKSKALRVISLVAFNGRHYLQPTAAVLYRLLESLRCTLCLDEIEGMDRQGVDDLSAILNSGYQKGTPVVKNVQNDRGSWDPKEFTVYAPIAFAGIRGLNEVLDDRCVSIVTLRSTDRERINRPIAEDGPEFGAARADLYALLLTRFRDVADCKVTAPMWLNSRRLELYTPLLAVASLADEGAAKEILAYAKADIEERSGLSEMGESLIRALYAELGQRDELNVLPGTLAGRMDRDQWGKPPAGNTVAKALVREGFQPVKRTAKGVPYRVTRTYLDELAASYGITDEGNV